MRVLLKPMKPLVFPSNLGFPKVILSVLLLIGILDIDFYIGYPFMDEQLYFLLLMAALGCAINILSVTLLVIGVALFFTYPYLSEFANDEVYTLRLLSWWIIPLIFMSLWKTCGKSFAIIFAMFMIYPFIVKSPTKSMDILSQKVHQLASSFFKYHFTATWFLIYSIF